MGSPADRRQADRLHQAHEMLLQGKRQEAEALYRELLDGGLENPDLLCNLAVIYWHKGEAAEMERCLRRALELCPSHSDAHYNLALVLAERGASAEAMHHYREALPRASAALRGSIHWNLAKLLLRAGDYREGWHHYEWRRHKTQPLPPICEPGMPAWQGGPVPDGELVLMGEQGLGDMLQFLRYAPAMRAFAPRVALALPESLHALVRASELPVKLLTPAQVSAQRRGAWLPLLSAPGHLGVTPDAVLVDAPYLKVPATRVDHWRQRLRAGVAPGERLVALHWQGNPSTETAELRGRSLPLQTLTPLAGIPGLRIVSLQKGPGSDQMADSALASRLVDGQAKVDGCWDFVDAGAIALACDLVISSDSALAHLAGGLGVPTWLLLHHSSDWRWGAGGDRTFWYPSVRLFRQKHPGDWAEVVARVVAALTGEAPAPPSANARLNEAVQLQRQHRTQEAERIYRQLQRDGFGSAAVLTNLGVLCAATDRLDEAVGLFEEALRLDPEHVAALANLAEARCQRGEWAAAEPLLRQALRGNPNHLQALNRLRSVASHFGRRQEAINLARQALAVAPQTAEQHYHLGNELIQHGGAVEEARDCYERALALRPGYAEAEGHLSLVLLLLGDYRRGLPLYEARNRIADPSLQPLVQPTLPRWHPNDPAKGSGPLLVVGEQGLGDMLQFMRYGPELRNRGHEIWLCLPEKLVELARISGIAHTVLTPAELEERQARGPSHWVRLMSLPWHLGVTPEHPLVTAPYLQTAPLRRLHWQRRVRAAATAGGSASPSPVLGVQWQGALRAGHLSGRGFPLACLAPLSEAQGVNLLSLQKGAGSEQLQTCAFRDHFLSCQAEVDACWDFVETAAIVLACDLVITCDTALAHLAGGLGVPTWLLLHHLPDWRWGLQGSNTFWYPSLRLFRQQRPGDWDSVIQTVRLELQAWLRQRGAPR